MKLHSNVIRASDVFSALKSEKEAGRIAPHVTFKKLVEVGSRTHQFASEVQLEAAVRDNGRRAGNSGSYGAMNSEYDGYAATYDEWGWLINALYEIDPDALWGSAKCPAYKNREDFDKKTGLTYNYKKLFPLLADGYWSSFGGHKDDAGDPYPFTSGYTANRVGRRGYGRITREQAEHEQARGWGRHIKHAPRYLLSYAQWACMEGHRVNVSA
jgi:hypothetical protein